MPRTRNIAAQGVADRLIAMEQAIDAAIASGGELAMFMPQARLTAHVSAEIGHEALVHATGAIAALVQARGQIVAAHRQLAAVKDELGLRELALGGAGSKPGDNGISDDGVRSRLEIVRAQAA